MSRNVTQNARNVIYASNTDKALFTLITISHSTITTPYRFINNTVALTSRGNVYIPSNFSFTLPNDSDGLIKEASLSICNVDREILTIIQKLSTTPTITMEVVLDNAMDEVEVGPYYFTIKSINASLSTLTGNLTSNCHIDDTMSTVRYTPQTFPGMYQ